MEALRDFILPVLPALLIAIAKVLGKKLAEVGGITPQEQAALDLLNMLEKFISGA